MAISKAILRSGTFVQIRTGRFWRLAPADMRRRWWLFRIFDWLARNLPLMSPRRGLLVIRMDGIGDMVLFRNFLDQYSGVFNVPKNEIQVLGCKSWEDVSDEIFAGYRVFSIDEHAYAKRFFYRIWVNFCVRRFNVAMTVCDSYFRRALMADSLAYVAAAPTTIMALPYINGDTRAEYSWYLSQVSHVVDTGPYPRHEIERHAIFLAHFSENAPMPAPPKLTWRDTASNLPTDRPYVVLNPGSNEAGRCWPQENYIELANRFAANGLYVVFVGKAKEKATSIVVPSESSDKYIINLTGKTSLPELFDLMNHATLVVSNDTGPAHVAVGLGAPTVVVVGGGHFGCFVPYPEGMLTAKTRFIHQRMDCYHCFWRCHKRDDPNAAFPCVAILTMDQVWNACIDLLPKGLTG